MLQPLWRSTDTGILFLYEYTPRSGLMRGLGSGYNSIPYNFKAYGSRMSEMRLAVVAIKELTKCDVAVGIPASTIKVNNIQRICDHHLQFLPLSCRPKRHKGSVDLRLESQRVRIEARISIEGQKVLLVDDIASTGSTMRTYEAILRSHGVCDIEKFAIAHKQGTKQLIYDLKIYDSLWNSRGMLPATFKALELGFYDHPGKFSMRDQILKGKGRARKAVVKTVATKD